jgi:hypothetical protein
MKTSSWFRFAGVLSGIATIIGAFLPWYGPVQRVNELFGLQVYSADELFRFDFTTIICGLLYLLFLGFAHRGWAWKAPAVIVAGVSVVISGYNFWRFTWKLPQAEVFIGLKLTLVASLIAIAVVLPIKGQRTQTHAN